MTFFWWCLVGVDVLAFLMAVVGLVAALRSPEQEPEASRWDDLDGGW